MKTIVEIITDHKWKNFRYGYEVPAKIRLEDYDWLEDEEKFDKWIKYRDRYYHLSEFMNLHNKIHCVNPPEFMDGYDGYISDSFFSGVLIKISEDGEQYKIATYIS